MKRFWMGVLSVLVVVGCGGFMEDVVLSDDAAGDALASIVAASTANDGLPSGASDLRFVQSTSIDWIVNAEFSAARSGAEPWFDALGPSCHPATTELERADHELSFFRFLGDETDWSVPTGQRWRMKRCETSGSNRATYDVSITMDGDPAWFWVSGSSH